MPGIYLHIPFCDTKCIYCDFYSITNHSRKNEFIDTLKKEITSYSHQLANRNFDSIFFGGGTPSLLEKAEFDEIFETLYKNYNISENSEITIEANPGTLDKSKLAVFRTLPINRISFGVQSFIDSELRYLTRIHSAEQAISSIKSAQDAGFENVNLDLIFALPEQSIENWQYNLNKAVELNTQHISAYSLIFEEGTPLFNMRQSGKARQADIELEQDMYELTMKFLEQSGYMQYEISNYAKPGFVCRHNLKYWQLEEYIAFGPSASSYIENRRWTNIKNIGKYIELIGEGEKAHDFIEDIDEEKSLTEHIFLGLRSSGIDYSLMNEKFNINFTEKYSGPIKMLLKNGWANANNNKLTLTPKGYAVCDEIVATYF